MIDTSEYLHLYPFRIPGEIQRKEKVLVRENI